MIGREDKMYSIDDGKELRELARRSIADAFFGKETSDKTSYKKYAKRQGVFVTLKLKGELRGCIGFPLPYYRLYEGVINCARAAAFEDPRFKPLTEKEFENVMIEISIMSVPEEIKTIEKEELLDEIKIGRDGLIIRCGTNSGLLLPQVFVDHDASPKKALEMLCDKAGLNSDAWKSSESNIERFQAQVFAEESPKGKIVEQRLD
jgi:uncharacterized protein